MGEPLYATGFNKEDVFVGQTIEYMYTINARPEMGIVTEVNDMSINCFVPTACGRGRNGFGLKLGVWHEKNQQLNAGMNTECEEGYFRLGEAAWAQLALKRLGEKGVRDLSRAVNQLLIDVSELKSLVDGATEPEKKK